MIKAKMKAQTITISAMKAKFDVETDNPVTDDAGDFLVVAKRKRKPRSKIPIMIMMKNNLHPFFGFGLIYGTGPFILSATEKGQ